MSSSQEPSRQVPGDAAASEPQPTWQPDANGDWPAPHPETVVPPWPGPGGYGYSAPPTYQQAGPAGYGQVTGLGPISPGPAPARRGHGGWVLVAAVVVAAGALSGVLATPMGNLPALTGPTPSHPSASASATPPPKPADVLKKNAIYALKVTGTCPSQHIPASWKAFQAQVRALVNCENATWSKALGKVSIEFSKPKITFYSKTVDSPCGHLDSKFPASYCSADRTLYFSRASYQQGRYYRLSVSEFVFHEYAHHVQAMAGIFAASITLKADEDITERRIELQAHCIAHYRLTHAGLKFSLEDRSDVEYQLGFSSDTEGHGSAKAGRHWGEAGLDGKSIGACNTWTAKASAVK